MALEGKVVKLRVDEKLGDYSGTLVLVEKDPKTGHDQRDQYRVSWGQGSYDVDWINTDYLQGAEVIEGIDIEQFEFTEVEDEI